MGNKFAIEFFTISRISFLLLMTSITDLKSFLSNAFILKMAQCGKLKDFSATRILREINIDKIEPQKLPYSHYQVHHCKNSIRM